MSQKYDEWALNESDQERLKETKEKTGIFTGLYAINHVNQKEIPIWITDFVLINVGTGAVQGCPGHDLRDFDFAKKFNIPIPRVITGPDGKTGPIEKREDVIEHGEVMINSEFLDGIPYEEAMQKTMDYFEKKGWGKRIIIYHLRDWIFSRQRYWGEPIPIIECKKCGLVPVPENELPVELPKVKSYEPTGTGESPLAAIKEWVNVKCPNCGEPAKRETDTMPNWAGSCWYFLRFADPKNDKEAWSQEAMKEWLPTDWYIGGAEHAVLHLLYARFWVKALYDLKLLTFKEPFMRLRNLGMILAEDHRKMSKSFGNVVNPDDVQKEFGADALRVYEMFMAPFDQEIAWSTNALQGAYRFMVRVWNLFHDPKSVGENENKELVSKLQKTIKKITEDIPDVKFNTSVASMMEFINEWEHKMLSKENAKKFLQVLAPFAPFTAEEIWHEVFEEKGSIHLSIWPKVNEKEIVEARIEIPVQVNGKLRGMVKPLSINVSDEIIAEDALKIESVKKHVGEKKYKVIYVKGKILNLVTV